jgi:integrase
VSEHKSRYLRFLGAHFASFFGARPRQSCLKHEQRRGARRPNAARSERPPLPAGQARVRLGMSRPSHPPRRRPLEDDRAVWATAFYAGLRRGELMALRDEAIDLDARGDPRCRRLGSRRRPTGNEGPGSPHAADHRRPSHHPRRSRAADGPARDGPDIRRDRRITVRPQGASRACRRRLEGRGTRADHVARMSPHVRVDRHRRRGEYRYGLRCARHASVTITWDRYHHLMPGTMDEAAGLIQAYIERA